MDSGDDGGGFHGSPPAGSSSTPSAYEPTDLLWDTLQSKMKQSVAALPSGIITVQWDGDTSGRCMEMAISGLQRDGFFVLQGAVSAQACDAVREQMSPYVDASVSTDGGARRPGAVLSRSRASWSLATHPFLRKVCEGVLGRQILQATTAAEVEGQLFADRNFKQHPYYLDLRYVRNIRGRLGAAVWVSRVYKLLALTEMQCCACVLLQIVAI